MADKKEPVEVILVSACLLGLKTRYDGKSATNKRVIKNLTGKRFIPICPEQLGGLTTPRFKSQITQGSGADVLSGKAKVIDEEGTNVTTQFLKGTIEVLKIAEMSRATHAVLKEKSPSCGVKSIKRGTKVIKGSGVAASALENAGIKVSGA